MAGIRAAPAEPMAGAPGYAVSSAAADEWAAANGEASFGEPNGLTKTESHQMDQLREKYGREQRLRDAGPELHVEESIAAQQAKSDAEFHARPHTSHEEISQMAKDTSSKKNIKVCDVCKGMRSLHAEYNNRVMEKQCERCEGEGVLHNGKPIGAPAGIPPIPTASASSPFQPGHAAKVRRAVIMRDIACLELQIEKYHAEQSATQSKLDADPGEDGVDGVSATQDELLGEFIHQIQRQVRTLLDKAEEKRMDLAALTEAMNTEEPEEEEEAVGEEEED
mmetsp:Transcript_30636/g.76184  ORF Transcript_30636/g.76184 Transcript_30636/m.76184 type:complete len:279 (-) Transcript_30636:152-988(-)